MKRVFYLVAAALLLCGCGKDEDKKGGIYGVVTDMSTAEPMRATSVELHVKNDDGKFLLQTKTVTYDDGHYEFNDLKTGEYQLVVNSEGYKKISYNILVSDGKTSQGDMQLERLVIGLPLHTSISEINANSVTLTASSDYKADIPQITEVGFIYATHNNPSNGGLKIVSAPKKGSICGFICSYNYKFESTITGLIPNTRYYVQAYMKGMVNGSVAIEYSNEISFVAAE